MRGTPDGAEAAMRQHLHEILQALPEVEKAYGYLFTKPTLDR